jgi:hypothetical protein
MKIVQEIKFNQGNSLDLMDIFNELQTNRDSISISNFI